MKKSGRKLLLGKGSRTLIFLLFVGTQNCGSAATETELPSIAQQPRREDEARADLQQLAERFGGDAFRECGDFPLKRTPATDVTTEDLAKALECGKIAAAAKQPFWIRQQLQGIDSLIFRGLLAGPDGTIFEFQYDDAPCGQRGCPSRFTVRRCPIPRVEREAGLPVYFCGF